MSEVPIPNTLETPPRSTGNAQQDLPLMLDWFYRAYLVIQQAVAYINDQTQNSNLDLTDLPNPATATTSSAQQTANEAYSLASESKNRLDNHNLVGAFTLDGDFNSITVTFTNEQPDDNYVVDIQAQSTVGAPPVGAYIIISKSYTSTEFSAIIYSPPGTDNSITYEWHLIRNESEIT